MPMLAVSCSRNIVCKRGELRHRGKLDHRLDLIFEQHRQDDDVARHDLEQRRTDRHGVVRHFGDQHAALVGGALADQAFADAQHVEDGRSPPSSA